MLYAYFGNKRKLFEAVVAGTVTRFMESVPFDATDLPCWAGEVFDFFVAHPEVWQLGAWHSLEPGESEHRIPIIEGAIAVRTREIRRAQKAGLVENDIAPAELLALVNAIARAWAVTPPERNRRRGLRARG